MCIFADTMTVTGIYDLCVNASLLSTYLPASMNVTVMYIRSSPSFCHRTYSSAIEMPSTFICTFFNCEDILMSLLSTQIPGIQNCN